MSILDKIKETVRGLGGTLNEVHRLPDGSGFATASWPLREDHWIYGSSQRPPMTMRTGTANPRRQELQERVREATRYAVKSATMNGKDTDFDPDALVQNMLVGLFGYHTADGLTSMGEEDSRLFDPQPVPPLFPWADPGDETIETIAQWADETFGPIAPKRAVERAQEEMDELRENPTSAEEAADVVICLARVPGLLDAVQRKMAVNRTRKWNLRGDGTGYHVKYTTN